MSSCGFGGAEGVEDTGAFGAEGDDGREEDELLLDLDPRLPLLLLLDPLLPLEDPDEELLLLLELDLELLLLKPGVGAAKTKAEDAMMAKRIDF